MDGTERARGRRSFTPQFKAETVDICRRGDRSIAQVARDYGLNESTVRAWVKQADIDAGLRSDGPTTAAKKERAASRRKQRRRRRLLVMGIAPIVFGCVLVVVGTVSLLGTTRLLAKAVAGEGIVVSFAEHEITTRDQNGEPQLSTEFCPVVRFAPPQGGATTEFEADDCSNVSAFRVGQSVRILYDQRNPKDARLDTWASLWGDTLLIPGGLVLMAVGVGILYRGRRDIRSVRPPPRREGPTSNRISDPEITE
jgi:transposase